jgi:protein gp37
LTLAENKRGTLGFPNGFDLTYRWHKLDDPLKKKQPSRIFVNSMSDLYFEEVSDDNIRRDVA